MEQLLKAIKTRYDTVDAGVCDALRAANTGGLYLERHKQDQDYPYMVVDIVSGVVDHHMQAFIKKGIVQFSIFDETLSSVLSIYLKLLAVYDSFKLTYPTDTQTVMLRMAETGPDEFESIWQVTVDYEVQRT